MGRTSSIDDLPADIRDQLIQRLIETNFSNYGDHEAWSESVGHKVSRSSIHRFSQNIEERINETELRLRCAEIAAVYSNADSILDNATSLLRWAIFKT